MVSLPAVVVVNGPDSARAAAALNEAGVESTSLPPRAALAAVLKGQMQIIVTPPLPGWRALHGGAARYGGELIVFGDADSTDRSVVAVSTTDALVAAVEQARVRILQTDRSVEEHALLERARAAELVGRFAQSIATQLTVPDVIREAIARTRDLCDASGASLLLIDETTGELFFDAVAGGAEAEMRRVRLKPGEGVAGRVAHTAQPLKVDDARNSPLVAHQCDEASGFQTGSIIAAPLLMSGDVLGVLEAVRDSDREPFTDAHFRRLQELAPHVCIAVHNAQMTAQLRASQEAVLRANVELEKKVALRTAEIARAQREWELTFNAIAEPISLQEGFTLRRVNGAYARRSGLTPAEVVGRPCHQVMAGRATPCPGCPLAEGSATLSGQMSAGGSTFRCSGFRLSDGDGRVMHYRDVTEEQALSSRVRASERLASVGQLASGAAHEINNPLGFVLSNLSSLQSCLDDLRGYLPPANEDALALATDGAEMISDAQQGAQRVAAIVKALRELSKQEISRGEPCCVNACVSRVMRGEPGLRAELALEADANAAIPPLQLDQVLAAIVKNARQASKPGQAVCVRTWADAQVHVEVRDEGAGIAPENLHRVFEPFFTTRGVGAGMGLGLTVAYGIVTRHGGTIDVESTPGRGSRFTVHLPRAALRPRREQAHELQPVA